MKSHLSTFNYWHCASVVMPSALSSMTILTCVFFLMIYSSGLGIAPVRALVLHVQGSEFNQVLNSFCFFSPSVKCCWKWCGLKRLIQKDLQLELNLDYRARACLKLKKKKNMKILLVSICMSCDFLLLFLLNIGCLVIMQWVWISYSGHSSGFAICFHCCFVFEYCRL
jgi:hypothetical protein